MKRTPFSESRRAFHSGVDLTIAPTDSGAMSLGRLFVLVNILLAGSIGIAFGQIVVQTNRPGRMLTKENDVDYYGFGNPVVPAPTNQWLDFDDALRTLAWSRATVRLSDWSQLYLKQHTRLGIVRRPETSNAPSLRLDAGEVYFSSRGPKVSVPIKTPNVIGIPKGTEFLVRVADGVSEFTMFDGEVALANEFGRVEIPSGRQGIVEPGQPPRLVARIEARRLVQWWIYYPAVINPSDLGLSDDEQRFFSPSLAAYRSGHLLQAFREIPGYPNPAKPSSDAARFYLAALSLAVGAVDQAESYLTEADHGAPAARALRTMIQAVQANPMTTAGTNGLGVASSRPGVSTSELLAESYAHQSTNDLRAALALARATAERAPDFGFGWARVAELEFSFGRARAARDAVERALRLSPNNAQAHCVHGFLLAAGYRLHDAIAAFDTAIAIDPALGNAWLGRGLCRRRIGVVDRAASRDWLGDLQTAAVLEPRRSLVRAYAGKGFTEIGDGRRAQKELAYAAQLDPNDPTPPLYAALELANQNRLNEAIGELDHSLELNGNRAVYRSRLLLDQDQAVRGVSLARIYRDAGLEDVAVREAARAVSYDYANSSAHQFLAESFDALRDPARVNLRYETVWYNELLLANLLSPVGAGLLPQNISQQEYSRLFTANRLGLFTSTEYRSDGRWRELASQVGTLNRTSYALDLDYQHNNGVRPNNELDRIEWYTQLKHQLTDRDSVYFRTEYVDYDAGDNFQHYDSRDASTKLRASESQAPLVLAALHRAWSPGIHTTLLGARLASHVVVDDFGGSYNQFRNDPNLDIEPQRFDTFHYDSRLAIWQAEVNQIIQLDQHTVVAGGRFQTGGFDTRDLLDRPFGSTGNVSTNLGNILNTPLNSSASEPFRRLSLYGYHQWQVVDGFRLIAGLAYDRLTYPQNFRFAPVTPGVARREQWSPKGGFQWDIRSGFTVRGLYARALGGISFDESVRLEPTQLAGFGQAFRSLVSEAEVGSLAAPRFDVGGLALDCKLMTRTFLGLQAGVLESNSRQDRGIIALTGEGPPNGSFVSSIRERLQYREQSLSVSLDQLLGDEYAVGAGYQWIDSRLRRAYPDQPSSDGNPSRTEEATLHRFHLRAVRNLPSGLFARVEAWCFLQDNDGYPNAIQSRPRPGEASYQLNLAVGYRFLRRRGEVMLGALNMTDQNYRLNSLTPFSEMPRERVLFARLKLNF